jgi:hypothetical protein
VVDDFKRCLKSVEEANQLDQVDVRVPPCWKTPPEGIIKVNFDATINEKTNLMGMGVIATDFMGNLLGAKRLSKSMLIDAHTAKLMAASHAVFIK